MITRGLVVAVLLATATASLAHAQSRPRLGFGVGVTRSSMSVSGERGAATGIGAHAAFGIIELEYLPFATPSPILDEKFTALSVLLGPRIRLGTSVHLRPQAGLQVRWWSGSQRVEASDQGLTLGVLAGWEIPTGSGWRLTPEAVLRLSPIELEGNVYGTTLGLRVKVSR